jgi:hypothetical protein
MDSKTEFSGPVIDSCHDLLLPRPAPFLNGPFGLNARATFFTALRLAAGDSKLLPLLLCCRRMKWFARNGLVCPHVCASADDAGIMMSTA